MKRMYDDAGPGESILKNVKVIQENIEKINKSLIDYASKSLEIFDSLSMINFEIKGVLRQVKFPVASEPDISKDLQDSILR